VEKSETGLERWTSAVGGVAVDLRTRTRNPTIRTGRILEHYHSIEYSARWDDKGLPADDRPSNIFDARLWRCQKQKCKVTSGDQAGGIVEVLRSSAFQVAKVERKNQRRHPVPPFITSTLQQEAARRLRYAARKTMSIASSCMKGGCRQGRCGWFDHLYAY